MMKNLYFKLVFFICTLVSSITFGQSIKGTIKDLNNQPIPGVNVILENTSKGSQTDFDGNYEISNVDNGTYTLIASFIGYSTFSKQVEINGNDIILNIDLMEEATTLDDIIITGVTNPRSKIESSVSVTTLRPAVVTQSAPRSTAEIFRTIPGIRSESSGGEGNANIAVRGVPISSGGSKYVQLQEDGLPVLLYGDIAFATSDMFIRFDSNVKNIEAIRGGSASTLASNSPGGIINIISKTGKAEQGSVTTSFGLNYDSFKTDIGYGGRISDNLYFHAGGFYRTGQGVRDADYNANNGGQFKFNLTKEFENGYIRLHTKLLNDRAAAYMPAAVQVSGTNANPEWTDAPNFDATSGTLLSPYFTQNRVLDGEGNIRQVDISDGMHVKTQSVGLELEFNLTDDIKVRNNGRFSVNSGRFVSPFPSMITTAEDLQNSINGNSIYNDLNGTSAGILFNDFESLRFVGENTNISDNQLINVIHMFDTELKNMNNFMNDFRLSKKFDISETNSFDITLGYFKATQNISKAWHWNTYLQEVSGNNARLIDGYDATNNKLTDNGLVAYGVPMWGSLSRNYDTKYDLSAPYMNVSIEASENFTIDAGLRYDIGKVRGSFTGGTSENLLDENGNQVLTNDAYEELVEDSGVYTLKDDAIGSDKYNASTPTTTVKDMNNDGTISAAELSVAAANGSQTAVNYDYDYVSYTLGLNYKLDQRQSVFARYSHGATAKADRILFTLAPQDYTNDNINSKDFMDQFELGYKKKFDGGAVYVTGFYSTTAEEGGFEATTNSIIENDYKSLGLEIEGLYTVDNFNLRGALTYTKAEITSGDNNGNTPRRQPDLIYNLIPSYTFGADKQHNLGLSFIGQTKAYSADSNELIMPGFVIVNGFFNVGITNKLSANLSANNILDTLGITEAEEGSITENTVNYLRARSLPGRSISLGIRYSL